MPAPQTALAAIQLVTPVLPIGTTTLSIDSSVLPITALADASTTRLEVSIYNSTTVIGTFATVGAQHQFSTSLAIVPTVSETVVQLIGRNYDPAATWLPGIQYAVGYRYADPRGNVQVVVRSTGASGGTQPNWSFKAPAKITKVALTSNVLTVTCANSFSAAGQQVYLSGITDATFLNGLIVTIVTFSGTQFTAALNHADYAPTAETGTADSTTADGGLLWANFGAIAITPTIKFTLLFFQSNLAVQIAPPSGIIAKRSQTSCTLEWVTPDYPGFIGVRVMISTDSAGVNPPFVQYGDLIASVERTEQTIINTLSTTQVNVPVALITGVELLNNKVTISAANSFVPGTVVDLAGLANATFLNGKNVTVVSADNVSFSAYFTAQDYSFALDTGTATSTISTNTIIDANTVMTTNFSSVDIPVSFINSPQFFAMFSTVLQDPNPNGPSTVYESVQNGPLTCGFVNLKLVSPADFPVLQRKEDIAGRLIGQITRQRPDLDLSPRSEIRDIFIDPFSIEAANMAVREWFARVAGSISAISQIDDSTGIGVSDPFQSSPYKQQIARAYGMSPQDTQNLIDEQFNILGEQAGLTRGTAATATVVLTFYTFQQPQSSITIPQGATVTTAADANTPSLNFVTQGQGTINTSNLSAFFNPQFGWWGVSVPAQCLTSGSLGNVGAGTIRLITSGTPGGINVTNLVGAQFGTDRESNANYAARIQARIVTGVDSGTRHGYLVAALSTPGIIGAQVVAAGDLEMLRDWDAPRQKHVFGTVDIYTRGTTLSQQDEIQFFQYQNTGTYNTPTTYLTLTLASGSSKFQISNFNQLQFPLYSAFEILVSRAGNTFYLGTDRAQFDNVGGYITLNLNDTAYQYAGSSITKAKVPLLINGNPATNQTALASLTGALQGTYSFRMFARYKSPFTRVPALQPVLDIFSVTGQATQTGALPSSVISLIHTSDFLLSGGSNNAGDQVQVALTSQPVQKTIIALTASPRLIDTAVDVPLDNNGNPLDILSVRSTDFSTLYTNNVDYKIVPLGPYHEYGLQILTSSVPISHVIGDGFTLTVTAPNEFGLGAHITLDGIVDPTAGLILNGQPVIITTVSPTQFTAAFGTVVPSTVTTGRATGSAIQDNQQVALAYNQFVLHERLTFVADEVQVLHGTLPTTLANNGFVRNTWIPESYGSSITPSGTILTLDGWDGLLGPDGGLDITGSTGLVGAAIPHDSRYIKVTYNNGSTDVVKRESIDFTLTVDPTSGAATVARILTGSIPDGGTIKVSYFALEPFTFSTQYPAFVEVLANRIKQTKHAAADVLVKAMVANPIDIVLAVTLDPNTSSEAVDPTIRTVINITLDNAKGTLYQSELIRQVQAITGVQSVQIPLIKCAKSDGSYDVGVVVPTGTAWTPLVQDPAFSSLHLPTNSWISTSVILPDSTLPSGGEPQAIVDFLYQGQVFRRASSVQDFLTNSPSPTRLAAEGTPGSFYIVGGGDHIDAATPLDFSYTQKVLLVIPQDVPNPGNLSFLCTYVVSGEGGAKDITVSSTEYLSPGRITLNYLS